MQLVLAIYADKKITDYINSMRGVGAWRVLKGDAVK